MKLLLSLVLASILVQAIAFEDREHVWDRQRPAPGWSIVGRSHPQKNIDIMVALKQSNLDRLDSLFCRFSSLCLGPSPSPSPSHHCFFTGATSTPGNSQYGRFMTVSEIQALVSASDADIGRVLNWLTTTGMS